MISPQGWTLDFSPFVLRTFGAVEVNTPENPMGLDSLLLSSQQACTDQFNLFLTEVRDRSPTGRGIFHMVQGYDGVSGFYPLNNWNILHPYVKVFFSNYATPTDLTMGLYTGACRAPGDDPNSYNQVGGAIALPAQASLFVPQLFPYLQRGISFLWLDYTSQNGPTCDAVKSILAIDRPVGGEAYPIYDAGSGPGAGGRTWNLITSELDKRPYLATLDYNRSFDPNGVWTVDPKKHEVHVVMRPQLDNPSLSELTSFHERGFIVSTFALSYGSTYQANAAYYDSLWAHMKALYQSRKAEFSKPAYIPPKTRFKPLRAPATQSRLFLEG